MKNFTKFLFASALALLVILQADVCRAWGGPICPPGGGPAPTPPPVTAPTPPGKITPPGTTPPVVTPPVTPKPPPTVRPIEGGICYPTPPGVRVKSPIKITDPNQRTSR